MKQISVIVPMFNEAQHIRRTLESVRRAAACAKIQCELIVVDNGSTDSGPQLAAEEGAKVLEHPGLRIGALRNRGAAAARSEWLAFLDADIEVPPDWLLIWTQVQSNNSAEVLALDCDTPSSAPWYARAWQRRSLSGLRPGRLRNWLPSPNLCLTRSWFDRVGGFSEELVTGEDKDFSLRLRQAGARLLSVSQPVVWHWGYEKSWQEWLGKEAWRQGSHLQLLRNGGDTLRLLRFPLLCLSQGLLTLLALASLLIGRWQIGGLLFVASWSISLSLAVRQSYQHREPLLLLQLWLLHWLRLYLGCAALIVGLFNANMGRPARG